MAKRRTAGVVSAILAPLLLAAAYVASPFHAAYALREAMKAGDAGYLEANIQWPTVRESLRASLHAMADPAAPAPTLASTAPPRKSLWARFKSYAARKTVDSLVDTYANPEDLPQLFTYGTTYRNVVHGPPEEKSLANLPARVREFWSRIRRAEFKQLTAFELEMRDRHTPDRTYTGLLELQGLRWKLTELRVHRASGVNGARPQV
jgi:hypothetical protein